MDAKELFDFREPINPDELWCVWSWLPYVPHTPKFASWQARSWVLARPGSSGLDDITKPEGFLADNIIAAIPFPDLQQALDLVLFAQKKGVFQKLLAPIFTSGVQIRRNSDGTMRAVAASSSSQDEQVLLSGKLQDLQQDVIDGERIVREKDYRAILDDLRPQDGLVQDWLLIQKDPQGYEKIRSILHPELYPQEERDYFPHWPSDD